MNQSFVFFQPEYVKKFQCNGQLCNAKCCKKWAIDIDKKTYKKYKSIKPKLKSIEITDNIKKDEKNDKYLIKLDEKRACPFLTEDNWCSIQKTYGADYLSDTCTTYPRRIRRISDFYESALSLSCPVAANLILKQSEPMYFEQTELSVTEALNIYRNSTSVPKISNDLLNYVFNVQYAIISILQERTLNLDQRLIVIGYFFDKLEELINTNNLKEIETLSMIYTSEEFLKEQVPVLINSIEFDPRDYMRLIFDVFGILYGNDNNAREKNNAQTYLNYLVVMLEIKLDKDGTASVTELVDCYNKHSQERSKFLEKFSTIFENYLIQEFFYGLCPWRVEGSIILNYIVFLITYKILELIAVSMSVVKETIVEDDIINLIIWYVEKLDHGQHYINPIAKGMEKNNDILKIMQAFLQG